MNANLKKLIINNLTDVDLKINSRKTKILAMTCFWIKTNFSAIIKHYGVKYYCYYCNTLKDIIVEKC